MFIIVYHVIQFKSNSLNGRNRFSAPPRIKKRALRLAYAWLTEKSCKERSDGIASLRASLFSATKRSYEPAAVSGGTFLFATYANKNAPPLTSGKAKWWS